MASKIKKRGLARRIFRKACKIFLYGLLLSILYIFFCKWVDPPVTITQINSALHGKGLQRKYIDYEDMGMQIKLAVLSAEDQVFPDHNGFDYKSIQKAMKHNQKGKSLRGASTISQQVAKNVFLWQGGGFFRKGLEVYFTFMIEKIWGKRRILEVYLNVAEMGPDIYGAEAAALHYFKKHAKDLTAAEAAMIAAGLRNPKIYTVKPSTKWIQFRYPWVLKQMNNLRGDPDIQKIVK